MFFEGKLGGRAIIGFSGVGVRVTEGGYQILLGDCYTITISSGSSSIGEVEGRTFEAEQTRSKVFTYGRTTFDTTNSGGSQDPQPSIYLIQLPKGKIKQFQLAAESR